MVDRAGFGGTKRLIVGCEREETSPSSLTVYDKRRLHGAASLPIASRQAREDPGGHKISDLVLPEYH